MRVLEHRRHSRRNAPDVHLNREGVELARRVAPTLGRFDRVVTSPKPRAIETAEALGFTVDAQLPQLGLMPDDADLSVDGALPHSFADYARLVARRESMRSYARGQAALMRRELERLPEGGRLLLVSHGEVIEFGAVAARPEEARNWGPSLHPLEGVRLTLDRGVWVQGEVLRVPK